MEPNNNHFYQCCFVHGYAFEGQHCQVLVSDFLKLLIHYFALFYAYNRAFKFHLIIGQVISLCSFLCRGLLLLDSTLVSTFQGRFMLDEPAIWGIRSTVEMFFLDSHHLPDAYEDYSGAVSWMSFLRGAVVFHLQQYVDCRGFELLSLVQICRDSCRVVSWIDPCFKVNFTLYFQYKMNLETLSKDGYSEKTVKLYFISRSSAYLL